MARKRADVRALGVIRLSRSTDASTSVERQREHIADLAARKGLRIVAWAEDEDVKGDTAPWRRPALGEWLPNPWQDSESPTDGRLSEFDHLVVWRLDRLSRRTADLIKTLEMLGEHGITVHAVEGDYDPSSAAGKGIIAMLGSIAEGEHESMKKRAKDSRRKLRESARFPGGTPPFGYSVVPANPGYRLEVDAEQAAQVRDIASRILEGETVNAIVMGLNRAGVPSPADQQRIKQGRESVGNAWRVSNLNRLMKSPTLLGFASVKTPDGKAYMTIRGDDGQPIKRADAILTPGQLSDLARVLDSRKGGGTPTSKRTPQPFLGVAQCVCGANLYIVAGRGGTGYWRCGTKQQTGACPKGNERSIRVQAMVEDGIAVFRRFAGDVQRTRRVLIKGTDNAPELADIAEAIDDLMEDRAAGLYRGAEASAKYRGMMSNLENRRAALEAEGSQPDRFEHVETGETWAQWLDTNGDDHVTLGEVFRSVGIKFMLYRAGTLWGRSFDLPDAPWVPLEVERLTAHGKVVVEPWRVGIRLPEDLRQRIEGV